MIHARTRRDSIKTYAMSTYLAFSLRNMANCCTEILRSDSLNSYGMFQPIGPYILLSWTKAWKKQSPNNSLRNSGPTDPP